MTSHTGRLYALAVALVVFFLAWAAIAARPWAAADSRTRVSRRSPCASSSSAPTRELVRQRIVAAALGRLPVAARAAADADRRGAAGQLAAAAAPSVRVVNLPPLTITRTS